jgi:hypothetical protein
LVEELEAPWNGLATSFVAEAAAPSANVVMAMLVVDKSVDTVGWTSVAPVIHTGVVQVDCCVSDTVLVAVERMV